MVVLVTVLIAQIFQALTPARKPAMTIAFRKEGETYTAWIMMVMVMLAKACNQNSWIENYEEPTGTWLT